MCAKDYPLVYELRLSLFSCLEKEKVSDAVAVYAETCLGQQEVPPMLMEQRTGADERT